MALKTTDREIRAVLKRQLSDQYAGDSSTLILDELGLRHGKARIDVAVVNGVIHGFEIKSDADTLRRLPGQVGVFNAVLDCVTLVVAKRYVADARKLIPNWWGMSTAEFTAQDTICLRQIRRDRPNPSVDPLAISKLLWRDEALQLLEDLGAAVGVRSKPRKYIYEKLASEIPLKRLRDAVRDRLLRRTSWRLAVPQT